jgi:AcrR family transcriptional regulator
LVAAGNFEDAFEKYLDAALEAYPGLFTDGERRALQEDIVGKISKFLEGDLNVSNSQIANLIKENLDKILYQQFRDQSMITGSDHGIHHIVMGNIHNSLAILDGCPEVTPREKLMVLQTMVDHDLGYTTYAAQADFGAAKDHPLASRAYVDQNINSIFTAEEQTFIRDSILSHSYPAGLDQPLDFANNRTQSLRNVVAVVDAMGTTQDTKLPSVFRQKEIQDQLFDVGISQLWANIAKGKKEALEKANPEPRSDTISAEINQLATLAKRHSNEANRKIEQCKKAMLKAIDDTPDANMPPALNARY